MMMSAGQSIPAPTTVTIPRGGLPAPVPRGMFWVVMDGPVRIWMNVAGTMGDVALTGSV